MRNHRDGWGEGRGGAVDPARVSFVPPIKVAPFPPFDGDDSGAFEGRGSTTDTGGWLGGGVNAHPFSGARAATRAVLGGTVNLEASCLQFTLDRPAAVKGMG